MKKSLKIAALFFVIIMFSGTSFAKSAKPEENSFKNRQNKTISLQFRSPTVSVLGVPRRVIEFGYGLDIFRSPQSTFYLNVQSGTALNLSTYTGHGTSRKILAGTKWYVGEIFFVSLGAGIRKISMGDVDSSADDSSWWHASKNTNQFSASSVGLNGRLGFQWQREQKTFGWELSEIFTPLFSYDERGISNDGVSTDEQVKSLAKRVGKAGEMSFVPRLIFGTSF